MKERVMPTIVVMTMIVQNTRPMAFQSPHARYICMPNMAKMNITMKMRNPLVRTNEGIGLCGEYLASTRS